MGRAVSIRDISKLHIRFEAEPRLKPSLSGNHIISGFMARVVLMAKYLQPFCYGFHIPLNLLA